MGNGPATVEPRRSTAENLTHAQKALSSMHANLTPVEPASGPALCIPGPPPNSLLHALACRQPIGRRAEQVEGSASRTREGAST